MGSALNWTAQCNWNTIFQRKKTEVKPGETKGLQIGLTVILTSSANCLYENWIFIETLTSLGSLPLYLWVHCSTYKLMNAESCSIKENSSCYYLYKIEAILMANLNSC
jgi:hypothetical protein